MQNDIFFCQSHILSSSLPYSLLLSFQSLSLTRSLLHRHKYSLYLLAYGALKH